MERVIFRDLGSISYQDAWNFQQNLHDELKEVKLTNRKLGNADYRQQHSLIFCEHPPVYTLGKSGSIDHLLLSEQEIAQEGFEYFKINRGGDITYHGPGQVVVYPIFDLDRFFTDVHRYVRTLEEAVILTLADFGIAGQRIAGYTGVWLPGPVNRKICAIGVHLSRWVTMHGLALNVNTRLSHFDNIVPCGIQEQNKEVTSMEKETGRPLDIEKVKDKLRLYFSELFGFEYEKSEIYEKRYSKFEGG